MAAVQEAGGTEVMQVMQVMQVGDFGRYALFHDSEGNLIGMWQQLQSE